MSTNFCAISFCTGPNFIESVYFLYNAYDYHSKLLYHFLRGRASMIIYFLLREISDKKAVEKIDKASNILPFIPVIFGFSKNGKTFFKIG